MQVTRKRSDKPRMANGLQPLSYSLIVGLGATGLSCVRHQRSRGVNVVVADTRAEPPGRAALERDYPEVALFSGPFDSTLFAEAREIVLSPGIPVTDSAIAAALDRGRPVYGDIELFAREARAPIIAITGSNGKSTVTTLVHDMIIEADLKSRVGGNLGPPALELLEGEIPDYYVLELSSFQLETTNTLNAKVSTVLNVSPDHMDRYASLDAYAQAKQRIFRGDGLMVVNRDDASVAAMCDDTRRLVGFTLGEADGDDFGIEIIGGEEWISHGGNKLLRAREVGVAGRHNLSNALAALAFGDALGLSLPSMIGTLKRFRGLPHRCEQITLDAAGVRWVNDSKATNVGATVAAINGLAQDGPLILIAGGVGKGADFGPLANAIRRSVETVILLGRDADLIARVIAADVDVRRVDSMTASVALARQLAGTGSTVLLSPACASFDMYDNYEARGRHFATLVRGAVR